MRIRIRSAIGIRSIRKERLLPHYRAEKQNSHSCRDV